MINVSVLITTLNEEDRLGLCLEALQEFDDVIVVDSGSHDKTVEIAAQCGARVADFKWDGQYPKKRQHCLENLNIKHDFVFFVDADEIVTPALIDEIKNLDFSAAGYFVRGQYVWNGRLLKHGMVNNKLALFNRHKIKFPVIDDLDIEGMGEIEGHYQPVLKAAYADEEIEQLNNALIHDADTGWEKRHQRYAQWEAAMIKRGAYPKDPNMLRQILKQVFRHVPLRGVIAFCHCYFLKAGFLDGHAGFYFALSRMKYYQMVTAALKTSKTQGKNGALGKGSFD